MKDKEFTIDDQIAILKAYKEGKTIQVLDFSKNWIDIELNNYGFDFASNVYRVKPEPTYRPYRNAKELDDDLKIHSQYIRHIDGSRHLIVCYTDFGVRFANNNFFNYSELLLNLKCTWSDGTPFGRKEDDED